MAKRLKVSRNTVMLALALAWAEVLGSRDIFIGVNAHNDVFSEQEP